MRTMAGPIQKPLIGLLGRLGLIPSEPAKIGVKGEALAGEPRSTGGELGPDGLLTAGAGYAIRDRAGTLRNLVEQANVERFLAESEPLPLNQRADRDAGGPPKAAAKEEATADAPLREAKEERAPEDRPRDERAKEERGKDVREDVLREAPAEETETREIQAEKTEGERPKDESEDEEDRPGWGWLADEAEERERDEKRRVGGSDPLGATHRCRGHLEDGTRCLRRPIGGTPYCLVHRRT